MRPITPRQADVLRYVQAHVWRHGQAPTRAEIGRALSISRPTAEQHLQALKRAGLVKLRTQWRGIFLVGPRVHRRPSAPAASCSSRAMFNSSFTSIARTAARAQT
jgi:DNA-binding GntR family transcriptional regulator